MRNETLEMALSYARRGWRVFPLHPLTPELECSCRRRECKGKHPLIKEWPRLATTDESVIRAWWTHYPERGIGLLCGACSGVAVVDVDPRNGGKLDVTPNTYTVETGGGGYHYYFKIDHPVLSGRLGKGIDFKADSRVREGGHFVVCPPTLHPSGQRYRVVADRELLPLPEWVLTALKRSASAASGEGEGEIIPIGETHNTLKRLIGRMRQAGLLKEEALEKAREINRTRCERELPEHELIDLVNAIYSYPRTVYTCDDLGNLNRFINDHGQYLRYCPAEGVWYRWDGIRWEDIGEDSLIHYCIQTIENIKEDILYAEEEVRPVLEKWSKVCRNASRVSSLLRLCGAASQLWVRIEEMNKDPHLLCCTNGVVDLRTGELRECDKSLYITKCTGVYYERGRGGGRGEGGGLWKRFLRGACGGDEELERFLQLAVGYTLTGFTDEEVIFFIYGPGGSGKTTFVETVRGVMGDYASVVRPQVFLAVGGESANMASPAIAKLLGKRLVISSELGAGGGAGGGGRLNAYMTKVLSGGDTVTARHLYKGEFDFRLEAKFWLTMNELPDFNWNDTGLKRRILPIPFLRVPEKPDPELKRKLRLGEEERREVLRWAVEGAMRWLSGEKLAAPPRVREAREEYFQSVDVLGDWLSTHWEPVVGGERLKGQAPLVTTAVLLQSFEAYCAKRKLDARSYVRSVRHFIQLLHEHGVQRDEHQGRWYLAPVNL